MTREQFHSWNQVRMADNARAQYAHKDQQDTDALFKAVSHGLANTFSASTALTGRQIDIDAIARVVVSMALSSPMVAQ